MAKYTPVEQHSTWNQRLPPKSMPVTANPGQCNMKEPALIEAWASKLVSTYPLGVAAEKDGF